MIELTGKNIDILCELTIQQACHDLIEAICKNKRGRIAEVKHFFRSEYFATMTKLDGEYLIKMCHEVAEEAGYKYSKVPARYKKLV